MPRSGISRSIRSRPELDTRLFGFGTEEFRSSCKGIVKREDAGLQVEALREVSEEQLPIEGEEEVANHRVHVANHLLAGYETCFAIHKCHCLVPCAAMDRTLNNSCQK